MSFNRSASPGHLQGRSADGIGAAPLASRGALAALAGALLLASLGTSIANVALPTFARVFSAPYQDVQWVVLAYLLAVTTLVVTAGRLGDAIGRRPLFLGGIVLFTAASAACGAASSLFVLIAARAAQGAGAAVITALVMAFVADVVPKERTGAAMGLLGTMSAVGTALGPGAGGLLIAAFGWRSIFLLNVPLGLVTLLLSWRSVPGGERTRVRAQFDTSGTLMLFLTLAAYALAMTTGRGRFGLNNILLLLVAAGGAVLFTLVERRVATPLVRLDLFRSRLLSAGFAMNALVTSVVMATLVVGPFYLAGALALGPAAVGLVMSCGPIVAALTGIPAGRLVDRMGAARTTVAALVVMVAGTIALPMIPAVAGVAGYIAPLILITTGYATFQAANNTAVMRSVSTGERGLISGILNLSRNLGLITGTAAMGALFAFAAGPAPGAGATAAGMRVTFAAAAGLVVIALLIAVRLRNATESSGERPPAVAASAAGVVR